MVSFVFSNKLVNQAEVKSKYLQIRGLKSNGQLSTFCLTPKVLVTRAFNRDLRDPKCLFDPLKMIFRGFFYKMSPMFSDKRSNQCCFRDKKVIVNHLLSMFKFIIVHENKLCV